MKPPSQKAQNHKAIRSAGGVQYAGSFAHGFLAASGDVLPCALSSKQIGVAESSDRLFEYYETAPVGYITLNDKALITEINLTGAALLGEPRAKLLQRSFARFVAPANVSVWQSHVFNVLKGAGKQECELTLQRKDGASSTVKLNSLRTIIDGQPVSVRVVMTDITGSKRVEDELRASVARLNETQRIAKVGSWTRDMVTGKLLCTEESMRMFEIDPGRFDGSLEMFFNVIHPDDRSAVTNAYLESLQTQKPYEITHRLLMNDGRVKWVAESCSSIFDVDGNPLSSNGVVQDVTERMQADIELRIAAVAFESREPTLVTDANAVIMRVNQAFTQLTGYSSEDLIGRSSHFLHSSRHDSMFFARMWEAIFRSGEWQGEIWGRKKNGEEYPQWLIASAVRNDKGTITHFVRTHQDITARKREEERIANLAFFDSLTLLPNRSLLLDRLKQVMTAGNRSGACGALMFLDLDHFKTLNDTLGHDKGDLLLQQVAQRLMANVRTGDTVARLGGDEFVIVLGNLDECVEEAVGQVKEIGEKILAALNSVYQLRDIEYQNSGSIGATLFRGEEFSIDELLKQADLAMYKSKKCGRNSLHFFDATMQTVVAERSTLKEKLKVAIQENQMVLHLQPQVDVTGHIIGAEVLVRWCHPERGILYPVEFIPLAEETRLILPLSQWVLESVCAQLMRWEKEGDMSHLALSVNVSTRQFFEPNFVDTVLDVITRTGIRPNRLRLELTESLLGVDVEEAIARMWALKNEGVDFSLDSFGTGHSSIANLKRMPLDQLKIDKSFVLDILNNADSAMIANTIVVLANSLNLRVVAAGVETDAQRDFLTNIGCNSYQGYFFSHPLPVDEFEQFAQRVRFRSALLL